MAQRSDFLVQKEMSEYEDKEELGRGYVGEAGRPLEGIDNAVDNTDLEPLVDIRSTEHGNDFRDCLHDHLPVRLGFILQVVCSSANDLSRFGLRCKLDSHGG